MRSVSYLILTLIFTIISSLSQASDIGFTNAYDLGFSPKNSGVENSKRLQQAVNRGGTIVIDKPGIYKIAATVYLGSNTTLIFGDSVFLKKVDEQGMFTHVFLNKGALTKTFDQHIRIEGLQIIVNGIDKAMMEVYGLRGHIAFFYVKDLLIKRFRCYDMAKMQFAIHVCTFEDLIIDDVIIEGDKDGIHLGRGKRFTIRNGVFRTYDDAIALNGHDYSTSNPELGWIENGVIENCHDLNHENITGSFFCRILAGAWIDWKAGMEVQQSDAVVSEGRIYRVQMLPDEKIYKSVTRPTHKTGSQVVDGINWGVVQNDTIHTAGVRNVVFRDIFLEKPRTAFSIHFDVGKYSRSYYPGATVPLQELILFDHVRVLHDKAVPLLSVNTPIDVVTITNSFIKNNTIKFHENQAMLDYLPTKINITNCVFKFNGNFELLKNTVKGKKILLTTSSNSTYFPNFSASVFSGEGTIEVHSDLKGLTR